MHQSRQRSWVTVAGLFLAGLFIVGLAVVTSQPFQERYGRSEAVMVSEAAPDGSSEPADGEPTEVADATHADGAPEPAQETKAPETDDAADEVASKPADEPPTQMAAADMADEADAGSEAQCCEKDDQTPPFDLIAKVPPGGLHNPYDWAELAKEHAEDPDYLVKQFRLPGCNECHGGGGGGGFCPALSQGVWFWGNTDDVLFRLIALGSAALEKSGFERYQYGTVKAPMPEMGHVIKTSDHLWKIVSFIRSINPPGTNPPEKVIPGKYTPPDGNKAE